MKRVFKAVLGAIGILWIIAVAFHLLPQLANYNLSSQGGWGAVIGTLLSTFIFMVPAIMLVKYAFKKLSIKS
jgi:hypothetical protein